MNEEDIQTVQIGKKGLESGVLKEINAILKNKGFIRVKILKSRKGDFEPLLSQVLKDTNATLIRRVGFTFILEKHTE